VKREGKKKQRLMTDEKRKRGNLSKGNWPIITKSSHRRRKMVGKGGNCGRRHRLIQSKEGKKEGKDNRCKKREARRLKESNRRSYREEHN